MKPYFQDEWNTIYCGDCREILPSLAAESVITDPVWPNAAVPLAGSDNPHQLLREMCQSLSPFAVRLAVHLGCDSDPRFLTAVPDSWPLFRVSWLEMARPHYKGRLMYGSDVAYLFGIPPASREGAHVIPGRMIDADSSGRQSEHPCPRKLNHAAWLVKWWSEPTDVICDPFCGSGTTLLAARNAERKSIGIEIEEKYCEIAVKRLAQQVMEFPQAIAEPSQLELK